MHMVGLVSRHTKAGRLTLTLTLTLTSLDSDEALMDAAVGDGDVLQSLFHHSLECPLG